MVAKVRTEEECRQDIVNAFMKHYGERIDEPLNLLVKELWESRVAKETLLRKSDIWQGSNISLIELVKRIP
jgi:hypothetical protein